MKDKSFSVKKTRELIRTVGSSKKFLIAIILTAFASFARLIHSVVKLSQDISSNSATTYNVVTESVLTATFFILACLSFFALFKTYLYYSGRAEKSGLPLLIYTRVAELIFSEIQIVLYLISSFTPIIADPVIEKFILVLFLILFAFLLLIFNAFLNIPFIKAMRFAITIENGEPKGKLSASCVFILFLLCVTALINMGKAPIFETQSFFNATYTDFWLLTLESGIHLSIYILEFIVMILYLSIYVQVRSSTLKPKKK